MMKRFNMHHTPPDEILRAGHEVVHDGGGHQGVRVYGDVPAPPLPLLLLLLALQTVFIMERTLPQLRLAQAHIPEGWVNLATPPVKTIYWTVFILHCATVTCRMPICLPCCIPWPPWCPGWPGSWPRRSTPWRGPWAWTPSAPGCAPHWTGNLCTETGRWEQKWNRMLTRSFINFLLFQHFSFSCWM